MKLEQSQDSPKSPFYFVFPKFAHISHHKEGLPFAAELFAEGFLIAAGLLLIATVILSGPLGWLSAATTLSVLEYSALFALSGLALHVASEYSPEGE